MDRTAYQADRSAARDRMESREDRGLPAHPANWWIECPKCEGAGEHTHNDSANSDPQCEYPVPCDECDDGWVIDGHVDLLHRLRLARTMMLQRRRAPYGWMRKRALSGSPLAQLRMIEAAIGCDLACRDAVQAWRGAA